MNVKIVFLLVLICLFNPGKTAAKELQLQCYECEQENHGEVCKSCPEKFVRACPMTTKPKWKTLCGIKINGTGIFERRCINAAEDHKTDCKTSSDGTKRCYCDTSFCNTEYKAEDCSLSKTPGTNPQVTTTAGARHVTYSSAGLMGAAILFFFYRNI